MQNANLHDAALDLSRLVDAAIAGERVVISQDGKPSVRLVPLKPIPTRLASSRGRYGSPMTLMRRFPTTCWMRSKGSNAVAVRYAHPSLGSGQ